MNSHADNDGITIYHFNDDGYSWAYQLMINGRKIPVTAFPNIDADECRRIADEYAKLPGYCHIEPKFASVHYSHIASTNELNVEITAIEPIKNFTIHPLRRGIKAKTADNVLIFTIDQIEPRYFIIEINNLPTLCLIVDLPETSVPSLDDENVVNAGNFLTDSTGTINQTGAFTQAIETVNGTGKTLYIPSGVYLTGTIKIHQMSDMNIYLAPGCLIRIKTSPPGKNIHTQGLVIDKSRNIRIYGRGCIDQQSYENYVINGNTYNHLLEGEFYVPIISQAPVLVMGSQDIIIEGLCVRNARIFNYTIFDCDRVTLRNCKALTPAASTPESTDSIDIDASDSITIDNMLAFGNDDCFAWGNPSGDSTFWDAPAGSYLYYPFHEQAMSRNLSHCVISGMVGWNPRANAVRFGCIGGSSPVGVDDILFENCDFAGFACSGVFLGSLKDNPENPDAPRYKSVRFVDCGFDTARAAMGFVLAQQAQIDLLEFNNTVLSDNVNGTVIEGPDRDVSGEVIFRNVSIENDKLTDLETRSIQVKNFKKVKVE